MASTRLPLRPVTSQKSRPALLRPKTAQDLACPHLVKPASAKDAPLSSAAPTAPITLEVRIHVKLASGAHADIVEGFYGPKRMAIKVLPKSDPQSLAELRAFQALGAGHANVVHALPAVPSPDKKFLFLPMEPCDLDLLAHTDNLGGLDESDGKPLFLQIVRGLRYLHSRGVYHLDVKPENVLLCRGVPKVADMGTAFVAPTGSRSPVTTTQSCGTPIYASPQGVVLKEAKITARAAAAAVPRISSASSSGTKSTASSVTVGAAVGSTSLPLLPAYDPEKADVWALGVTFFVLVTGFFPWKSAAKTDRRFSAWCDGFGGDAVGPTPKLFDVAFGRSTSQKGTLLSAEFMDLLWRMLHPSERRRYTMRQVEAHPFFSSTGSLSLFDAK